MGISSADHSPCVRPGPRAAPFDTMDVGRLVRTARSERMLVIDQAASSASNFVWLLAASILLKPDDFGAFGIGATGFGLVLGTVRTTSHERLAIDATGARRSETSGTVRRHAVSSTTPLLLLALWALAIVVVWIRTGNNVWAMWLVAAPLMIVQDRLRYVALVERPVVAVRSDLAWLVTVMIVWAVASTSSLDGRSATWLVVMVPVILAIGVASAGTVDLISAAVDRDLRRSLREVPFVVDAWLLSGSVLLALVIVAGAGSLSDSGRARVLLLVFQPLFSLAYAGRLAVLGGRGSRTMWPWILATFAAGYGFAATAVVAIVARNATVPAAWQIGVPTMMVVTAAHVARGLHQGLSDLARRTDHRGLFLARASFAALLVGATAILTPRYDVLGFAIALSVAFWGGAIVALRRVAWR